MLIDCPGCGKSYHIIKAALGSSGRRVVCPRCDSIWFVAGETDTAPEDALYDAVPPADAEDICLATPIEIELPAADVKRPDRTAAKAARRQTPRQPGFCAGLLCLAISMALIGFRAQAVRLWPPAATAYAAVGLPVNLRGLAFSQFHTVTLNDGQQTVLGVEGAITNLRSHAVSVPPIRFAIRDALGREIYSWSVPAQTPRLGAHATSAFRARLAAPPEAGRDVLVEFAPMPQKTPAKPQLSAWGKVWRFSELAAPASADLIRQSVAFVTQGSGTGAAR
jgi:predicted Zn finger-like uncharacterized protein